MTGARSPEHRTEIIGAVCQSAGGEITGEDRDVTVGIRACLHHGRQTIDRGEEVI